MKKMIVLCLSAMLVLTACSSNDGNGSTKNGGSAASSKSSKSSSASGPATHETQGNVYDVALAETFLYHRQGAMNNVINKVEITLTDYEVIKEKAPDDTLSDRVDYLKLYTKVENVGDENSHDMVIYSGSFDVFDADGKEIAVSTLTTQIIEPEDEFNAVELRPGGKNEGYLYITIEEGTVPAEVIYYDAMMKSAAHANQYVIKLN